MALRIERWEVEAQREGVLLRLLLEVSFLFFLFLFSKCLGPTASCRVGSRFFRGGGVGLDSCGVVWWRGGRRVIIFFLMWVDR